MSTLSQVEGTERRAPSRTRTVGMVGGGQLARMTHQAAIDLGIRLKVLAETDRDPAVLAGAEHVIGRPDSIDDLRRLAADSEVVTFDHEKVPPELLRQLEDEGVALAPGCEAKLMAQDKLHARLRLEELGYPVPPFESPLDPEAARSFAARHGTPVTVKSARGGYDGRGVWQVSDPDELAMLFERASGELILEPTLEITTEIAVIVVRSTNGERVTYPAVQTVQRSAMCREIVAPAPVPSETAARARSMATDIAEDIGATGVLAVEFFVTADGLLVNELALRPHNSGHYTIEGCVTSQFEQHLRAVLGLPLGLPSLVSPAVATVNVVGPPSGADPRENLALALTVPGAQVHLYGKEPATGRKLGHVTVCGQDSEPTRGAARMAVRVLEGGRP